MNTKYVSTKYLLNRLSEEGLSSNYQFFLLKYEKTGQLTIKRNPITKKRILTRDEVESIIAEIKRNGAQFHWDYRDYEIK